MTHKLDGFTENRILRRIVYLKLKTRGGSNSGAAKSDVTGGVTPV